MASLRKNRNGSYHARKRIPDDVREEYSRLYGQRHEAKFHAPAGTQPDVAKQRFGEWIADVEGRVKSIRAAQRGEGVDLSHREAVALAGEWYKWFVAIHEDDPGDPKLWDLRFWQLIEALQEYAPDEVREQPWKHLEWTRDPDVRRGIRPVLADLGHTAQFLAGQSIVLTNEAQAKFLDCVLDNYIEAILLLERRAKGDYESDEFPREFPTFQPRDLGQGQGISIDDLFRKWVEARQPSPMTIESWRGVFNSLAKHFSGRSAKSITDNEAQDWIDSLVTEARSAVTVNNTWVRATKAVFGWGVRRKLLLHNPFAEVQIELPRQKRRRESKAFDEHELQVILKAAAAINDTAKPDDAAKRWMPWLLAYSGARPGEIGQLRGQDVRQDQGCWYLDLTPDAGLIKTGQARRVSERCTEPNGAVVAPPTAFTSKNLQDVK